MYELVGERALGGAELTEALGATYAPGSLADARAAIAASGAAPFPGSGGGSAMPPYEGPNAARGGSGLRTGGPAPARG
ncbi:hypothetical protein [Streptomyces sp. NBC_00691]|uniref:hypothetical protein n=1 Tax=Streptomyces sp. NBC_00691 TaxID=2903671 RepID=UPI002E363AD7|nr:hypothetical protein [Streptomyces sp. NBC_00691]